MVRLETSSELTDVIVVEGSLEYSPALPFYTGRQVLLVNSAVGYFALTAQLRRRRASHRTPRT